MTYLNYLLEFPKVPTSNKLTLDTYLFAKKSEKIGVQSLEI